MEYKYVVGKPFILTDRGLSDKIEELFYSNVLSNFGPYVKELEEYLCKKTSRACGVTTCNATQALELTIQALDLPKGSYVAVPSYTFIATVSVLIKNDLIPLFIDINPWDFCMSYRDLLLKTKEKEVSLIIPVALFGNVIDTRITDYSMKIGIPVIFDCAHSLGMFEELGVQYGGSAIDSLSTFSVFSFHPTKAVSGIEGGVVVGNNKEVLNRIRKLTNFDFDLNTSSRPPRVISNKGTNAKMNELQALVNLHQYMHVDKMIPHFKQVHEWYKKYLPSPLVLMPPNTEFSNYSHIVCDTGAYSTNSYRIIEELKKYSILAKQYFYPVHLYEPFSNKYPGRNWLPVTNSLYTRTLSLPTGMHIEERDVRYISESLGKCI